MKLNKPLKNQLNSQLVYLYQRALYNKPHWQLRAQLERQLDRQLHVQLRAQLNDQLYRELKNEIK
jgi:hypothetical protein